jgi:hypothetical protein
VRFDIEEQFKGVPPDVRQVWVDPGNLSSCYTQYSLGERYLIFAGKGHFTNDNAALRAGIDLAKHPTLYYAPACSGSHRADGFPNLDKHLAILRAYQAGSALPRVLGHVYLYPFRGWPELSGPALKAARVTLSGDDTTLVSTTDENGNFSLADAPAGFYNALVDLEPFRMKGKALLHVPEVGCGYADFQLATNSTVQGTVLDNHGRPAAKIPEESMIEYPLRTTTDKNGKFTITGVPDVDVYLSAGEDYATTDTPYNRVYYPEGSSLDTASVFRLKPGEQSPPVVLVLAERLAKASVKVQVLYSKGGPGTNARVRASHDDRLGESARTNAHGRARVPCIRGLKYELEAQTIPQEGKTMKSLSTSFTCGDPAATITLVLNQSAR